MLMVVEGAVSNPDNLPMDQIRILVWRESDKAQGAGCRNCRDRRGCLYRANPCPAKAKTGQCPVSGGTRHQHAEKQSRQGRLSALLPGRLCYSGGGRSLFAANEKGSTLPRCFYAPPGRVGRAEALKKQVLLFLPLRKENPLARSEKIVILH